MTKLSDELELRYDGPIPATLREQMRRSGDSKTQQRMDLERVRDQAAADLKRIEGLLETCSDEMQETFLNIDHNRESERLKYAEIFLRRLK